MPLRGYRIANFQGEMESANFGKKIIVVMTLELQKFCTLDCMDFLSSPKHSYL